jgi:hypothetical protein
MSLLPLLNILTQYLTELCLRQPHKLQFPTWDHNTSPESAHTRAPNTEDEPTVSAKRPHL